VANHDEGNLSTGNIDPRYEHMNNGTKKEEAATVTLLSPSNAVYVRRLVMWRGDETLLAETMMTATKIAILPRRFCQRHLKRRSDNLLLFI
jgi:hypothetical protein